ncbi:hypothetical protein ACQR09_31585 [Bradyrhizobium oligotrophicum]|uniref:hypothetical protein n=1 Tax=Bradyrhizobium oligotrophicum TaxID=44255 RepID=UPI003EB78976
MHHQDPYEIWLRNLEQIDDNEELARTLHKDNEFPNGDPRVVALFRRATSGSGYYSQLLQAYFEPV